MTARPLRAVGAMPAADRGQGVTMAEIGGWPAVVDVRTAAKALGIGKSAAYEAIRVGTFPVKTLIIGGTIRVVTSDLLRVLSAAESA